MKSCAKLTIPTSAILTLSASLTLVIPCLQNVFVQSCVSDYKV